MERRLSTKSFCPDRTEEGGCGGTLTWESCSDHSPVWVERGEQKQGLREITGSDPKGSGEPVSGAEENGSHCRF